MKLLVTGRNGQVARCLDDCGRDAADVEIVLCGRPELDLLDHASLERAIENVRPDIVVSAAAYTAVDQAEDEPELAHAVNAEGPGALAHAAAARGIPIIHLSTDYVFSGEGDEPHSEEETPDPRTVYGRTKLVGERLVAEANPQHIILRTAWVYSPYGKNFVKTMLKLAEEQDEVRVVDDQYGNPTSAYDIANAILTIARKFDTERTLLWGTYHFAGNESMSWADFAERIFSDSAKSGGARTRVIRVSSDEFPTKSVRPRNSTLETEKIRVAFDYLNRRVVDDEYINCAIGR
ncbi:dTDP-4-dehydrorhamnose reductase [Pararhizobium mangrovi]|uniref:dTDP-4-dehydrorhamnose reductase n=1 Tax=Pararhizobium mangrovi TaxID=2590452 RepID=A0A506U891_9HYPH|nr:dTDP-4-dehydrorhamnose reductase [Pararhizobium mangrovi]TPW30642.1 dTDP-4-dehydrorhamnose reductase [Pararhizobium mangrovi]